MITLADVREALPYVDIGLDTTPTEDQVDKYITTTEGEVRVLLVSAGGVWPTDPTSDAATFLHRTILEGVKELTLRAIYGQTADDGVPSEVEAAATAYKDRLAMLPKIAKGMKQETNTTSGARSTPLVAYPFGSPALNGSFADWTKARAFDSERIQRPRGVR